MPYVKTRPLLSPVFNDDYFVYEWNSSINDWRPNKSTGGVNPTGATISWSHRSRVAYTSQLSGSFALITPDIIDIDFLPEQYVYQQGTSSIYFLRVPQNTNKYGRVYAKYVIPSATFSSKYSTEIFDNNILRTTISSTLYPTIGGNRFNDDFITTEAEVNNSQSFLYYGSSEKDSLYITNNYVINYRSAYGTMSNPPAPTESNLFTDRPITSEMAEINYLPFVRYDGFSGGTPFYYIVEYNNNNQIATHSVISAPTYSAATNKVLDTNYIKFKKLSPDVKYIEVWQGPSASNIQTAKSNRRTKLYTLYNNCNEINNLDIRCLVFQNNFGTFDSYDFMKLEDKISVSKVQYDSGLNFQLNKSMPINVLGFPTIYTKEKQTYDRQNRISNIKYETTQKVISRNLSKENLKWLQDLMSSENVFEYQKDTSLLKPILIEQSSIQIKPINNIYSQLVINYNYSQKQITR